MKHGTRYAYVQGCRCEMCTEANTDYTRARRKRQFGPVPHGTPLGRMFYLCACDDCQQERNSLAKVGDLVAELKTRPCADCGHTYPPESMDFDHLGQERKVKNVSQYSGWGVFDEIMKCEVVCANCHRQRTRARAREAAAKVEAFQKAETARRADAKEQQLAEAIRRMGKI